MPTNIYGGRYRKLNSGSLEREAGRLLCFISLLYVVLEFLYDR